MDYQIKRSARKTIALQILPDGKLLVRCPYGVPKEQIAIFVKSKNRWIAKHMPVTEEITKLSGEEIGRLTKQAKQIIPARVAFYAEQMDISYGNITVRHQRTRWGSCTSKGNLNFNCLLVCAPPEVLDYVVVHELCHKKHMNHSKAFWQEVETVFPDYKNCKKWLKEQGRSLIARL